MHEEPALITPGVIAERLGAPIHRVSHILRTRRHLKPFARAGNLRLYDEGTVAAVRQELHDIDQRKVGLRR